MQIDVYFDANRDLNYWPFEIYKELIVKLMDKANHPSGEQPGK